MADVYQQIRSHQRQVRRRQAGAARRMLETYQPVRRALRADVEALEAEFARAVARGDRWTRDAALSRARQLEAEAGEQVRRFARQADRHVFEAQAAAVDDAQRHAKQLADAQLPARSGLRFDRLPSRTLETLTAQVQGPVGQLFREIAPAAGRQMSNTLLTAVAQGLNPRQTGRLLARAGDFGLHRAQTIARTETMRAYRESSRVGFQENSDIVQDHVWWAELDDRTCGVCLAMHGTPMRLGEPQGTHPNCRCTSIPRTKSYRELGLDAPEMAPIEARDGGDWLASQPEAVQRQVLGPGKQQAWQRGDFDLDDLVQTGRHPRWGPTRTERPLAQLVG